MTGAGVGRGKVILLGEHAVVYGHPALAAALDLQVTAQAEPAEAPGLTVPAWGIDTRRQPDGTPARALTAILAALGAELPLAVTAQGTVPPRAGLGSSAALSVAVARACAAALGRTLVDAEVERLAGAAENIFHGNPSGIDVALATHGGAGTFRRGAGLTPLAVAPFALAVGLSGRPRDTAARVADVAARRREAPDVTDARLATLGELADAGRAALLAGDVAQLGALFDRAHEGLRALGLSAPELERLCALAREAGAAGAKLTGAGGGGAAIAIGQEERVVAAWRRGGFEAFVVRAGAPT